MAEPLAVVGIAASIGAIVELLSKSIRLLHQLRQHYTDADLTFLNLVSRVTALKASLAKIKEWADNDLARVDPHDQLIMDLDDSITCCRIFVEIIHAEIAELTQKKDGTLDFTSRTKLVFSGRSMCDLQKKVERQTNALILLLTACN